MKNLYRGTYGDCFTCSLSLESSYRREDKIGVTGCIVLDKRQDWDY
ncbi:hypothetical protein SLW70_07770 [Flavobacterium sp. NG2]|nr:hypothetical protein [Flavobacterium sp. NG2]WPR73005.1 hypothetical protein SLW70_07770 [Flavobacterium sp. NG2]